MNSKLVIVLSALALAAIGLAACGGGGGGETTAASTGATTTTDTGKTTAGGAGGTINVAADPGGQLAYDTGDLKTKPGEVEIDFENDSSTPHNVRIENSSGQDIGGTDTITGSTTTATVDLPPGTYTYYCSVDSHRQAGMQGTLTVK